MLLEKLANKLDKPRFVAFLACQRAIISLGWIVFNLKLVHFELHNSLCWENVC